MVDERENWISEELILVEMDIIPRLLTDLWFANISIDISSWLFHPFLENIRKSVKCQFVGKLFFYTHSERFYFLDKIVTAVSVYRFDIAFSNEMQSKFWTSSGKCGDFCPDRLHQTDLDVNTKLGYCVQSPSDGVASVILVIVW